MTNFEIVILVWVGIITFQVIQNMDKIRKIGWDMTRKMDKPPEPSDLDKWKEERAKRPKLTKKELDEIMTPEEKAYWKETNGTGYPNGID